MHPRQIRETVRPVLPSLRYSMVISTMGMWAACPAVPIPATATMAAHPVLYPLLSPRSGAPCTGSPGGPPESPWPAPNDGTLLLQRRVVGIAFGPGCVERRHVRRIQGCAHFPSGHQIGIRKERSPDGDEIALARGQVR